MVSFLKLIKSARTVAFQSPTLALILIINIDALSLDNRSSAIIRRTRMAEKISCAERRVQFVPFFLSFVSI